jgi:cephalosporin hydroxylase
MTLWETFLDHRGNQIPKWTHYFPIYERHFAPWRNRSFTFLEIGVLQGGSAHMWTRYFGPLATIVGIDIDPACQQHQGLNINVRIGDQSDPAFLQSVIDEFGVPDVVLDDGSHQQHHINTTFEFLYPQMRKGSIYMIEDLHCSYWDSHSGGLNNPNTFINKSKAYIDQLNIQFTNGELAPNPVLANTFAINYYNSIVVLEKGNTAFAQGIYNQQGNVTIY